MRSEAGRHAGFRAPVRTTSRQTGSPDSAVGFVGCLVVVRLPGRLVVVRLLGPLAVGRPSGRLGGNPRRQVVGACDDAVQPGQVDQFPQPAGRVAELDRAAQATGGEL